MARRSRNDDYEGTEAPTYEPGGFYDQLAKWYNQNKGTQFGSGMDYIKYQWGPQASVDASGNIVPSPGVGIAEGLHPELTYDAPDTFKDNFGLYATLGIAGGGLLAGMGGAAAGAEGALGAAEGAAGAGDIALSNWFDPSMLTQFDALGSGSTLGAAEGGGMGFFDDLLQLVAEEGAEAGGEQFFTPNVFQQSPNIFEGISTAGMTPGLENTLPFSLSGGDIGTGALSSAFNLGGGASIGSGGGFLDSILKAITPGPGDLTKLLLGTNASGGSNSIFDLFGDKGLLGTGLGAAPALAAINYAKNTSPFDTSRLESLYSQFDPSAQAFQYDTNTGLGRERLTSNLARRGVSGSSFGNADLTNFNTTRDLGRQALLNQGVGTQANIATSIIDTQAKDRALKNQLYSAALLALSGSLSPRQIGL